MSFTSFGCEREKTGDQRCSECAGMNDNMSGRDDEGWQSSSSCVEQVGRRLSSGEASSNDRDSMKIASLQWVSQSTLASHYLTCMSSSKSSARSSRHESAGSEREGG